MKLVYIIIYYRVMKVKFIDSSKLTSIQNHSGDSNCCMMVPAAFSSLVLFHHEDLFTTLPGSLVYYQLAPCLVYNDVYVDDHFRMEMVVNVNHMRMCCEHMDDVSLHR